MDRLTGAALISVLLYLFLLVGVSSINNQLIKLNNNLENLILPEISKLAHTPEEIKNQQKGGM